MKLAISSDTVFRQTHAPASRETVGSGAWEISETAWRATGCCLPLLTGSRGGFCGIELRLVHHVAPHLHLAIHFCGSAVAVPGSPMLGLG